MALPDQHPLMRGAVSRRRHGISSRRIPLLDLANETFILYRRPSGPGLYDSIIAACRAAGFSPRIEKAAGLVAPLYLAYRDETPSGVVKRFIESVRQHR
ncbi:MAG TPA: hypothetical protein VGC14_12380 [Rhizobium sp.]